MPALGAKVEYGLHCMLHLVQQPDIRPSVKDLAEFQGVSTTLLAKIFTSLRKAGLVDAEEGVAGGYRLAKSPEEISVLDVVEAIEGKEPLFKCREVRRNCVLYRDNVPAWVGGGVCAIHAVMIAAETKMREELARTRPELANDRIVTVRTSLDPGLQRQAERAVLDNLRQHGPRYHVEEGAVVVVVPETGAVRAMVGGKDYGESQFNRAVTAIRQPGSSFKPFVYITAFMNGYSPASVVPDAPISIGGWSPRNYSRGYAGPVTLKTALTKSINTIPVRLAQAIGRDKIVAYAHAMGITTELLITRPLPLGVAEVTVIDMAASYASFASGGLKVTPTAILEVRNSAGEAIYEHAISRTPPERLFPEEKAGEMNEVLVNVVENGTGRRARVEGVTAAGKTGTTQAYRDGWFVGYTGNYAAAVWFGNDDFTSTARMTGGSIPAMTWQAIMEYAHKGIELRPLPGVDRPPRAPDEVPVAGIGADRPRLLREQSIAVLEEIGARLDALGKRVEAPSSASGEPVAQ